MSVVYYGKYAEYFEIGRTELIRAIGVSYKEIEEKNVMLPVVEYQVRYFKPAKYDDVLRIKTTLNELPTVRFITECEIYNQEEQLLAVGKVVLVFVNSDTGRPIKCPNWILDRLRERWKPKTS